jgi:hypothetical protein
LYGLAVTTVEERLCGCQTISFGTVTAYPDEGRDRERAVTPGFAPEVGNMLPAASTWISRHALSKTTKTFWIWHLLNLNLILACSEVR